MARSQASRISSRKLMAATATVLLALGLLPTSLTGWAREFRGPVEVLLAPVQGPITSLIRAARPKSRALTADDATIEQLTRDRDEFQYRYHQSRIQVERLSRQIADLSGGLSLNPDLPVRQIPAPVIGGASDAGSTLLKIKAGRNVGIEIGSVAVVAGVHLVGRVTGVGSHLCDVRPITDRAMGQIQGAIYIDDLTRGPTCALKPTASGRGTLAGDVEAVPATGVGPAPPQVRAGMLVRVVDGEWPPHSQGLIIGVVEEVETKANQRQTVTVRPVYRVDRVSQVTLRVLGTAELAGPASDRTTATPEPRP